MDDEEWYQADRAEDIARYRAKPQRGARGDQSVVTPGKVSRDAEREIKQMLADATAGRFRASAMKTKRQLVARFRRLLRSYRVDEMESIDRELAAGSLSESQQRTLISRKRSIVADRNSQQGKFDEAVRTPRGEGVSVQEKYVRGAPARPYHETTPGKGSYAQPDYSVTGESIAGGQTRLHVNLKSNDLSALSSADARAIARDVRDQAVKNASGSPKRQGDVGHLPEGDEVVISFNDKPPRDIQEEMTKILFEEGTPITQVRFGESTWRRPLGQSGPPTPPPEGLLGQGPRTATRPVLAVEPAAAPTPAAREPERVAVRGAAAPATPETRQSKAAGAVRPEAQEPSAVKRRSSTPSDSHEIPHGTPGSVELIGHAQAGVAGAVMNLAMKQLNEVARRHPDDNDLTSLVSTTSTILDAEGFIKNPQGFVAGKIKAGIFESVFSHYREKLATIRQQFEQRFPPLAQIHQDPVGGGVSLETYRKDYEAARVRLRVPAARQAFLYVGVALSLGPNAAPEVVRQRLREVDEALAKASDTIGDFKKYQLQQARYQWVMFLLTGRLEQLSEDYASMPTGMTDDLRTRGHALREAARVFQDASDKTWQSGLVVFVPVLDFATDMETVANGLDEIASQFESFASVVGSRQSEYDHEVQRLQAESTWVAGRPLFGR